MIDRNPGCAIQRHSQLAVKASEIGRRRWFERSAALPVNLKVQVNPARKFIRIPGLCLLQV
jgi:hypothetical protein